MKNKENGAAPHGGKQWVYLLAGAIISQSSHYAPSVQVYQVHQVYITHSGYTFPPTLCAPSTFEIPSTTLTFTLSLHFTQVLEKRVKRSVV